MENTYKKYKTETRIMETCETLENGQMETSGKHDQRKWKMEKMENGKHGKCNP